MTPATTKRQLPARPTAITKTVTAPTVKTYINSGDIKATDIRITLEDGSTLTASGGHAADEYNWLMDCERYCASHPGTVAPYLGPKLNRVDVAGKPIPASQVK
jgi:hypothetical protein